jgi:colicin import membrane protein
MRYKKIMGQERKTELLFVFLSLVIHALIFGSIVFFTSFHVAEPRPEIIQVDLVSFAPLTRKEKAVADSEKIQTEPSTAKEESVEVKPEDIPKAIPKAIKDKLPFAPPEIKPEIGLKTKPKNLKKLMAEKEKEKKREEERKKEAERKKKEKAAKEAAKKIAELEKQSKSRLSESLERIKKTVANQDKAGQKANPDKANGSSGYKGSVNSNFSSLEERYQKEIALIIQENWVFTDVLAGIDSNIKVLIRIKILKNGKIKDIIYESRSGNQYLDESAKKAITKANPLPPLPYGMDSYDVGFIFTPKGVL